MIAPWAIKSVTHYKLISYKLAILKLILSAKFWREEGERPQHHDDKLGNAIVKPLSCVECRAHEKS